MHAPEHFRCKVQALLRAPAAERERTRPFARPLSLLDGRSRPAPIRARRLAEQQAAAARLQDEPEDAESIALAIRLQQEEDEQALRDAIGVPEGDDEAPGSPSQYSYEQLMRLTETVGEVSRGASSDVIEKLRTMSYAEARADPAIVLGERCSICQMEWEEGDTLRVLRCRHAEHADCVDQWLAVNKSCPLCQCEILSPAAGAAAAHSPSAVPCSA